MASSPAVEVAAAAERQAGLGAGVAVLRDVVDDEDGNVVVVLEGVR